MGYVYKNTIRETGKWYIGSHNGNKKVYHGSGLLWNKALEKYGYDSYDTEILYEGDLYREYEENILKELDAANDSQSYNMKNEALGGAFFGENNGMFGKKLTEEQKYNCGKAFRGKKRPEHSKRMSGSNNPAYRKNDHTYGLVDYAKSRKGKTNKEFYGEEKSLELSKKLSESQKGIPKPGTSKAMEGSSNPSAKSVIIDGVTYGTIKEAMMKLNLSRYKILKIGEVT